MKTTFTFFAITICLNLFSQSAPVNVTVLDMKGFPYAGDKVYFVTQSTKVSYNGVTNANGKFHIDLPSGFTYDIKIHSIGDELEYNTLEIPKPNQGEVFDIAELTISYELPKNYTINNLQFESGQATLKKESLSSLNNLIEFMKLKPTLKIGIEGHTDSDGEENANLLLSQKRAEAVKQYLISKGIGATRLTALGFGETEPIADNSTSKGKQQNRRTEIVIK